MENQLKKLTTLQSSLLFLALKVKNYHWNIKGADFFETHEQLDKFYDDVNEQVDATAEKLVMFNTVALGSYSDSKELSFINEAPSQPYYSKEIFESLEKDLNAILTFIQDWEDIDFRIQPLLDEIVLMAHSWSWKFSSNLK